MQSEYEYASNSEQAVDAQVARVGLLLLSISFQALCQSHPRVKEPGRTPSYTLPQPRTIVPCLGILFVGMVLLPFFAAQGLRHGLHELFRFIDPLPSGPSPKWDRS